jgi:hypothetical protein
VADREWILTGCCQVIHNAWPKWQIYYETNKA